MLTTKLLMMENPRGDVKLDSKISLTSPYPSQSHEELAVLIRRAEKLYNILKERLNDEKNH